MTLLVGAITRQTAFCISDRLLTQKNNSGNNQKKFDETSNKTIVYASEHGMFSICYTGTAYIKEISTDRWIAEKLSDLELEEGADFVPKRRPRKWSNIGALLNNLVKELNLIWPTLPRKQRQADLGFLIAGWQYVKSKPKWRPILWGLDDGESPEESFKLVKHPRFYPQNYIALITAGVSTIDKEREELIKTIEYERINGTPTSAKQKIVEGFQNIAKSYPAIGRDCLSVMITWDSSPYIVVEYHPDPDNQEPVRSVQAPLNNRTGMLLGVGPKSMIPANPIDIEAKGAYFCPWIITNHSVTPPSSIVGTVTITTGDKDLVKIIGSLSPPNIIGGFLAQKRPKKP